MLVSLLALSWLCCAVPATASASSTCASSAPPPNPLAIQISKSPRIYIVDNVFSAEECEQLIKAGIGSLQPAKIMSGDGREKPSADYRQASTTTLMRKSLPIVDKFRQRMANALLLPEENGEELQLTRYTKGEKYEAHFDSSLLAGRIATAIAFLGRPEEGGELAFPWAKRGEFGSVLVEGVSGQGRPTAELQNLPDAPRASQVCHTANDSLLIQPRLGRIVVWFNHSPDLKRVGYEAMHLGCPVVRGEKYITQVFFDWYKPRTQNGIFEIMKTVGLDKQWLEPLY